jgi:copper chaperone CopZ
MRGSVSKIVFGIVCLMSIFSLAGFETGLAEERRTLELRIIGVCPVCDSDVKSRVVSIPGVMEADLDLIKKKLFVTFDSESVSETKIIITLREGGYEVRRPFREERLERVALEISGMKDNNDITEIERTFYAFYDVDRVEILKHLDRLIAVIDFKKGGLDPGQLAISLKDSLPGVGVEKVGVDINPDHSIQSDLVLGFEDPFSDDMTLEYISAKLEGGSEGEHATEEKQISRISVEEVKNFSGRTISILRHEITSARKGGINKKNELEEILRKAYLLR